MRVLLSIYRDDELAGGSVRVAEILARSLRRRGIDLHVAVAYGAGGRIKGLLGDDCSLLGASGPKDLFAWRSYRRLVKTLRPDVVHYVDGVAWMVVATVGLPAKRIMHQHFRPDVGVEGWRRFRRIRWLFGTADKVVAISQAAARQLVERCRVPIQKVAIVHNAIDEGYLSVSGARKPPGDCVLGMAVRVVEDKGIEDSLVLLRQLPSRYRLVIAGDGPARKLLESRSGSLGVANRVSWLGSVRNIAGFYGAIDFYLFMSWYEGFGLSVAEAMASGKPVVGLLGDGEIAASDWPLVTPANSVLIPRTHPNNFGPERNVGVFQLLADQIIRLDGDAAAKNDLVVAAAAWIEQRFSSDRYATQILQVYESA